MNEPYWHIHHETLMEFATEPIENRIAYIKNHKPPHEVPARLRLLRPVQGALPPAVTKAWGEYDKAWDAYNKASVVYDKAWAAYTKAWAAYTKALAAYTKARDVYSKARDAYNKARDAHNKASVVYDKASVVYNKAYNDNLPATEALHAKECPGCPWNGSTIFP